MGKLIPLLNNPNKVNTGFNSAGYNKFMADNFKIIDKYQQPVMLKVNPAQESLNKYMEQFYNILVLKARKMGFSSDVLGIATTKFLTGKNEKCVSMSFDSTSASKQLARAKYYIKTYEEINNIKVPYKYNSTTNLVWEGKYEKDDGTVEHFQNILQVGTARSTSFGRGDDISFLHLTEVAFSDVYTLMAGVGEACLPGAHKVFETTADGYNTYKRFWDESMIGKTGFACLFYSPLWEYCQAYINDKIATLGRLGAQEYPMTPEQAFITSGQGYFNKTALAVMLDQVMAWENNHVQKV